MRETLIAEDGKIYTNGTDYGRVISLAIDANSDDYYEITEEEYNQILASKEATEEDV